VNGDEKGGKELSILLKLSYEKLKMRRRLCEKQNQQRSKRITRNKRLTILFWEKKIEELQESFLIQQTVECRIYREVRNTFLSRSNSFSNIDKVDLLVPVLDPLCCQKLLAFLIKVLTFIFFHPLCFERQQVPRFCQLLEVITVF
jgi:hypothetical protein